MSEADGFLARWSRRKRSAAARRREKPVPKSVAIDASAPKIPAGPVAGEAIAEHPALPPIELLGAASDITPFLAPGVPAELTRQALRRAWAADPAIRDFVGLSENAWDFNAPGGVPGFGPLTPEDVRRLVDAMTGTSKASDPVPDALEPAATEPPPEPTGNASATAETATETPVAATQPEPDQQKPPPPLPARRHGGALPQ